MLFHEVKKSFSMNDTSTCRRESTYKELNKIYCNNCQKLDEDCKYHNYNLTTAMTFKYGFMGYNLV